MGHINHFFFSWINSICILKELIDPEELITFTTFFRDFHSFKIISTAPFSSLWSVFLWKEMLTIPFLSFLCLRRLTSNYEPHNSYLFFISSRTVLVCWIKVCWYLNASAHCKLLWLFSTKCWAQICFCIEVFMWNLRSHVLHKINFSFRE